MNNIITPVYTVTGKVKGKKYCKIGDNKLKKQIYKVLSCMISRCYLPSHKEYPKYGGRGIKICDEWIGEKGLDNFYEWAINNGFDGKKNEKGYNILTIDRIDNDKGYSPDNCRWVDRFEQAKNKTTSIWVEYNGEKDTLINFCRKLNLDYHAVFLRIYRRKWSIEKALSTPIQKDYCFKYNNKTYNLKDLAKEMGVHFITLKRNYIKNNYDIDKTIKHIKEKQNAKNL